MPNSRLSEIAFSQPIIDSVLDKVFERTASCRFASTRTISTSCAGSAPDIVAALADMPGATDVVLDQRPPLAQIAIEVDRAAAARYGINVADISDLIQTGIGGGAVSQLFIGERHYDVGVRFPEARATASKAIGSLVTDLFRRRAGAALAGGRDLDSSRVKAPSTAT